MCWYTRMLISGKEKSNRTKTLKRSVNKLRLLFSSEVLVYCDFFLISGRSFSNFFEFSCLNHYSKRGFISQFPVTSSTFCDFFFYFRAEVSTILSNSLV